MKLKSTRVLFKEKMRPIYSDIGSHPVYRSLFYLKIVTDLDSIKISRILNRNNMRSSKNFKRIH